MERGTVPCSNTQKASWYKLPEITRDVDTFYIYATEYSVGSFEEGAPDYATLDNAEMLEGVKAEYIEHASTFEGATNVFVPYYRQAGLRYAGEIHKKTGNVDAALLGIPYDDIAAALDYYFENYNGGRPFIIAWNTEGPKNMETNAHNVVVLPNTRSINPLNWKLDETYAPASMNLGSLVEDEKTGEHEIVDIGADAQINLARGVVVTNAKAAPMDEESAKVAAEFFGSDGRHGEDYSFFYNNIKENVDKRVAAYLKGK